MRGIDPKTEAIGAVGGEQEKVSALRMVRVLVAGEDKMRNGCGSRPAIIRDFPAELAGWGQVPALGEGRLSDRHKAQRTGRREGNGRELRALFCSRGAAGANWPGWDECCISRHFGRLTEDASELKKVGLFCAVLLVKVGVCECQCLGIRQPLYVE